MNEIVRQSEKDKKNHASKISCEINLVLILMLTVYKFCEIISPISESVKGNLKLPHKLNFKSGNSEPTKFISSSNDF